ncbi:sigma 54-interacting transcriptional regulator [Syntrophothermus lipocalidus]|uniref:HTH-type transcriptional regulatory protein TyrR n=1 Tax=Syntrophothermus lipocalidus (strain DSM 12680 / TGB-C1) TaxID=643648 RepID=D7CLS8_SYNLT|nr:sigma 54-interacting transcriptional regulator [Syntrophothermus lipocalidus]ADI01663.1 putative sigma54 specific transcriptional regulator [Syntrophothermus lipocalidus DSM 12680]
MKFKEVMTPNPLTLSPDQTVREVASIFLGRRIDGAPVVNEWGELIGLFTKSHIMRVVAEGRDLDTPVRDLMTKDNIITAGPEDDIDDFYQGPEEISGTKVIDPLHGFMGGEVAIQKAQFGRLPIVEGKKVVGMFTRTDTTKVFLEQLQKVGSELVTILDSVHNGILSVDRRGDIRVFNRAAERLLGKSAEAVLGKNAKACFPTTKILETLKTGEARYAVRVNINNKTLISNHAPIIKDGEIIGAVAVFQDITELEEISRELEYTKELNAELDAIFESSYDGLFVTDGNGVVVRLNKALERTTGLKGEEMLGKNMRELVDTGYFSDSVTLLAIEKREPVTLLEKTGAGKIILVTGNPIFNQKGEVVRVLTNCRDITELTELRDKLERMQGLSKHYATQLQQLRMKYAEWQHMVISSAKMENLMELVVRLAQVDSTILIQGESGVGKELIAETIHANSPRRKGPFIKVNCGAIPENLLESELFGYEEGAFTGARKEGKAGTFELAGGGILFLDEIGELPLNLQVKLLRVLQDREITRVGGTKSIPIDVRIIAGTNRDLAKMVEEKLFREDLFYRLNVVPLVVPPLRERLEEIPAFVSHFLNKYNQRYSLHKRVAPEVIDAFMQYNWPGNVRELENLIERLVVTTAHDTITCEDLPPYLGGSRANQVTSEIAVSEVIPLRYAIEALEKQLLEKAFAKYKTTRKIAKELGVNQSTVVRKAAKYGLGTHRTAVNT